MINYNSIKHTNPLDNENNIIVDIPITHNIASIDDLDEKELFRYILKIEDVVRKSYEYKNWINTLKNDIGFTQCTFFKNVGYSPAKYNEMMINMGCDYYYDEDNNKKMKIEQHHYPFPLYDISSIILNKRNKLNQPVDLYSVASEIMYCHYIGIIGVVPLSITVHELYHNAMLFIPLTSVFGRYDIFVEMYKDYIDPLLLETLKDLEKKTLEYRTFENSNLNILRENNIFIKNNNDEFNYNNNKLQYLRGITSNQMNDIKNNGFKLPTHYNELNKLECPITFGGDNT